MDGLFVFRRKPRIPAPEPMKLANNRQNNLSELRLRRIDDLISKGERTDQEEKELKSVARTTQAVRTPLSNLSFSNLELEHEFDRRVEEFHFQGNGHDHDDERRNVMPVSSTEMKQGHPPHRMLFLRRIRLPLPHRQVLPMK